MSMRPGKAMVNALSAWCQPWVWGAEFSSSVVADAADRHVEDLEHGVLGREMPLGLGHFAELVVQRLDRVGGVDDLADCGVERGNGMNRSQFRRHRSTIAG